MNEITAINLHISALANRAFAFADAGNKVFNFTHLESRANTIKELKALSEALAEAADAAARAAESLVTEHNNEIALLGKRIKASEECQHIEPPQKITVEIAPRKYNTIAAAPAQKKKQVKEDVPISGGYCIKAYRVPSRAEFKPDGQLYYIEDINMFATQLFGNTLMGNIGNIFQYGETQSKVRNCNHGALCNNRANCAFFHDPRDVPGSRDIRNYCTANWVYAPNGPQKNNADNRNLKFGSRDNIANDIVLMSQQDISRHEQMTMHWLLTHLLLKRC